MKSWLSLAIATWMVASTAFGGGELENGSTSIFHVFYTTDFEDTNSGCKALIVVTSDKEVWRLTDEIEKADGPFFVYLKEPSLKLRLHPVDRNHLVGRVVGSGRRVIVVNRKYADDHGFDDRGL